MGNEQLVYFHLQQKPLIVRRQSKEDVEFGQIKKLFFSKDKMIFINPDNEVVINKPF